MDSLFRRLFLSWDNLTALLAALLALALATFGIFSDLISQQELLEGILVVLAFLLIAIIVERETRLQKLNASVDRVQQENAQFHGAFLKKKGQLEPFSDYIDSADELFYTGGHAQSLLTVEYNTIKAWLSESRCFKVILQDPGNKGLQYLKSLAQTTIGNPIKALYS